jgi:signal transduction histidine kinase
VLSVVDDGVGFDPAVFAPEHTIGLRSMKQRAELLGGTCELESKPREGTRVTARIPVRLQEGIARIAGLASANPQTDADSPTTL